DVALFARGAEGVAKLPLRLGRRLVRSARRPRETAARATEVAQGIGEVGWELLNPAPRLPLNSDIGPHRRYRWVHSSFADFKVVKDAFGGTINDVVRAPLPVYADDPVERLRIVREEMSKVKQSKQVMGAQAIVSLNDFAPPTVLAQAARLNFSTRLFNLIVTNVPGPQFPLYVLGRELETVVPVAFLPSKHALAVAIFSYDGKMSFGLLGDFDSMEDIDVIKDGLVDALGELVDEAAARRPAEKRKRAPEPT